MVQIANREYGDEKSEAIDFVQQHWNAVSDFAHDLKDEVNQIFLACFEKMKEKIDRDFGHFKTIDQPDDKIIPVVNLSMVSFTRVLIC